MRKGFTLIELLVVIAIIAVLAIVVVLTLNPIELIKQSRDSGRLSDMSNLNTALALAVLNGTSLGSSSIMYFSVPDPSATSSAGDQCQGLGLPTLLSGWSYHCASTANYKKVDGTGWMPVNFSSISSGNPLGTLPADVINQTSTGLYYTYVTNGSQYETTAITESNKYISIMANDGGSYNGLYEKGNNLALTQPLAYLSLSTSTNKYLNTPATTPTILTGTNFRIEADVQVAGYGAVNAVSLLAKDNAHSAASARHWGWGISNNQMIVDLFDGSSYTPAVYGSAALSSYLTDGVRYKLRADVTPNDGSGGSNVKFYYSTDGVTYLQLGSTVSSTAFTVNPTSDAISTTVAGRDDGQDSPPTVTTSIFHVQAWSDLTGTNLVVDMHPANAISGQGSFQSGGATWTFQRGSTLIP